MWLDSEYLRVESEMFVSLCKTNIIKGEFAAYSSLLNFNFLNSHYEKAEQSKFYITTFCV